jgi:hypothetical protein
MAAPLKRVRIFNPHILGDVADCQPLDSSKAKFFFNFGDRWAALYFGCQLLRP